MAFLNLNYRFLMYEDSGDPKNPDVRIPDIHKDIQSITIEFDKSERTVVYQNEIKDIVTTQRNILSDATTEYTFERPISTEDNFRIKHTGVGTAPAFRTNRNIGGAADTQVSITRVTNYVARIQNTGGTPWNLASVQVNDIIKFDKDTDAVTSPFSAANKGKSWIIQNIGTDFIDFVDNGSAGAENVTLGADFASVLKAVSSGSVRPGDLVDIDGSGINPSNHGKFSVKDVSDDFLEFVNPLGVEETVTLGTNTVIVFEYLIGFVHLRADAPIKIRFGNQTEYVQVDRIGSEAIFLGSPCTYKIQAMNDGAAPVTISIQHAHVLGTT